ncbi:MAG: helix-turn-helix transcriptional regulator [Cognatishimia sp.]
MVQAAKVLGDKWTLCILREAFYGVKRFDDMLADLELPKAALSGRLATLVEEGLLEKSMYQEPGHRKRAAYVLTQKGRDAAPILVALMNWGQAHVLKAPGATHLVTKSAGKPVKQAFVLEGQETVARDDLSLKVDLEG